MNTDNENGRLGRRYTRWMMAWAVVFLVSAGAVLLLWRGGARGMSAGVVDDPRLVLGVTLVTAATSLVGFVSTTWLAWRKESRDSASYKLQVERQQLEIERLRLELEKERDKDRATSGAVQ